MSQQFYGALVIGLFVVAMIVFAVLSSKGIKFKGKGILSSESELEPDSEPVLENTEDKKEQQLIENMRASAEEDTPDEKIYDTQTTSAPVVQAGFPGNTLPPAKTNVDFPPPEGKYTEFNWGAIPNSCSIVYIGATMKGDFRPMKALANFSILQTPPENNEDIYGNMSIFVEGGKVGMRLLPGSKIFDYHFDYRHHEEYKFEMVIYLLSAFTTRVELWIDGSSTGHSFTIRDVNMGKKLSELPPYVLIGEKVTSTYLQTSPE